MIDYFRDLVVSATPPLKPIDFNGRIIACACVDRRSKGLDTRAADAAAVERVAYRPTCGRRFYGCGTLRFLWQECCRHCAFIAPWLPMKVVVIGSAARLVRPAQTQIHGTDDSTACLQADFLG